MVWFKVDDKLHSHPKTSNASLAAMGLWSVAGSWCADHLTDGRVPAHMIQSLSRGAVELADELVTAGLWVRVKDGYRFHQWHLDSDGTKRNPTRKEVEQERRQKAEAGRKGGLARANAASKSQAGAKQVLDERLTPRPDPTRPSPSNEGERASAVPGHPPSGEPPPPRCPDHIDNPTDDPCGGCGRARKALEAWEIEQAQRERHVAAVAKSRSAKERAELVALAIRACNRCDHLGRLPSQAVCTHEPEPVRAAELAAAARANIRPGPAGRQRADPVALARQRDPESALDQALAEVIPIRPTAEEPA